MKVFCINVEIQPNLLLWPPLLNNNLYCVTWILISFRVYFILHVFSDHLSYVTIYKCYLGRLQKTWLAILMGDWNWDNRSRHEIVIGVMCNRCISLLYLTTTKGQIANSIYWFSIIHAVLRYQRVKEGQTPQCPEDNTTVSRRLHHSVQKTTPQWPEDNSTVSRRQHLSVQKTTPQCPEDDKNTNNGIQNTT